MLIVPSGPSVTVLLPPEIGVLSAVVNGGHEMIACPLAGVPSARKIVPVICVTAAGVAAKRWKENPIANKQKSHQMWWPRMLRTFFILVSRKSILKSCDFSISKQSA